MNWTLEDFYAGDKVAVKFNRFSSDVDLLYVLTKKMGKGNFSYYWYDSNGNIRMGMDTLLPSMPLSYFISLLDAQDAQAQPEYIYEPFSEEAAKGGAQITYDDLIVEYIGKGNNGICILNMENNLFIVPKEHLAIRRTIETKEVECYVYEDGFICSEWGSVTATNKHGQIINKFTHTIKIPKK